MGSPVIQVEQLSKKYKLGERAFRYRTIRETLSLPRRRSEDRVERAGDLWALRDVDLEVRQGEVVGIVGRNGAGKSTLLKVIARITEPTSGVSRTRGRLGALLEVGTGFHHELTGRENVFLNGAILGMPRREIRTRFDEIVAFADVERFLDTPLKRYSSGMYLRLAFAVAAHFEPDIMVVDEILAVGDAEFQRKCLGRMSDLQREGRTVVFVSHDLGAIGRLCSRAIWLDGGAVVDDGQTEDILERYLGAVAGSHIHTALPEASRSVQVISASVLGDDGEQLRSVRRDHSVTIALRFVSTETVPGLDVALYLLTPEGTRVLDEACSDARGERESLSRPGEYEVRLTVPPILAAGRYIAGVWIGNARETFVDDPVVRFDILPRPDDPLDAAQRRRILQPRVHWQVQPALPVVLGETDR